MANINKDDKVVDELYQENQRLYTKLGEVYDDYITHLDALKSCWKNPLVANEIDKKIKELQEEVNKVDFI